MQPTEDTSSGLTPVEDPFELEKQRIQTENDAARAEEDEHKFFLAATDKYEKEDEFFRTGNLRSLKKKELYWRGEQRIFWNDSDGAYKSINDLTTAEKDEYDLNSYDRVINVYRPWGESIVAALSVTTPGVMFYPDDADNAEDIITAKAYSQLGQSIAKHNKAPLLAIKALAIMYNQGLLAMHNYQHTSPAYGMRSIPKYENKVTSHLVVNPQTGQAQIVKDVLPHLVDVTEEPKSKELIDVFGSMNVVVPSHVRLQSDTPYLRLEFEQHISVIRATYKEKFDELKSEAWGGADYDGRYARSRNTFDDHYELATVKIWWLRPTALALTSKEEYELYSQKYPDGAKVVIVNNRVLEIVNESLDDHWTLTFPIYSETIHAQALGEPAIEIQELRNDAVNLADQLIRHGVPETFVDAEVLDFNAYNKTPKYPGQIFPVKPRAGQPISNSFQTIKTATLSQEVGAYREALDQDGQFVTSAFPSIYGGQQQGGSKTYAEYSMSHQQALQRISTYWKLYCYWWSEGIAKAAREYAQYLIDHFEDDRYVKKNGKSFINVWTRHAQLEGKIGSVEPEASEDLPLTPGQIRDLLVRVIQFKDEKLNNTLFHPENAQMIAKAMGMPQLYIPGDDDRTKQLIEIQMLSESEPLDQATPSVDIEPDVDDDDVHIQIMRAFLVSPPGMDLKNSNAAGYANCIIHLKRHVMHKQAMMVQPSETPAGQPQPTNAVGR